MVTNSDQKPTVAILGCGYVGLTTAAILANCGYKVYALEPLADRLSIIQSGKSFFYEAGIDALITEGLKREALVVTDSYESAVREADIIFCCMGTPDNPDGSSNLTYVFDAVRRIAPLIKPSAIFVQKSTVPVGTGDEIRSAFKAADVDVAYVSNPEFLREGTAILDTLWADRIVVGSDDSEAAAAVLDVYRDIEASQKAVAQTAGLSQPNHSATTRYMAMGQNAAELVKVSANAFLALKISFANSIAKLADETQADITEVMDAVGADKRIGRAFLNAGRGYGGGCFPKDVSGLIRSAESYGVKLDIMHAVETLNDSMPDYIIDKVAATTSIEHKKIAVLGLAFKSGTSDTRRSPAIAIANALVSRGADVIAYDPQALHEAKSDLEPAITLATSLEQAVKEAELLFVATDWPEFTQLDFQSLAKLSTARLVVDCMNCLDPATVRASGFDYIGVGRS